MLAPSIAGASIATASPIGHWIEDTQGLPAYALTAKLPAESHGTDGAVYPMRQDPIFLLGNYRLSLFVHGSGIWQIVTGERAWARLNASGKSYGANRAVLRVKTTKGESSHELVGLDSLAADPAVCRRTFGTGFAQFEYALNDGLSVVRTISVAPSQRLNEGHPGFIVSVALRNQGTQTVELTHEEAVLANYEAMLDRLRSPTDRLAQYAHRVSVNQKDLTARCDITVSSADPTALRDRLDVSRVDAFPPSLTLLGLTPPLANESEEIFTEPGSSGGHFLGARFKGKLGPGQTRTLHWLVSLVPQGEEGVVAALRKEVDVAKPAPYFRDAWKRVLPDFSDEKDPVWRREMTWHAYVLEAMATYNEFYRETYIPQGQTYDYEMDLTAAPRDHLQHALAVCYTNPALAKSCLRFVLKKMTTQGELPYTASGVGRLSNVAWNTSDQQIYLFYAIGEYLRITKDYSFLNEVIEPTPAGPRQSETTLQKLVLALMYLRDEVSTGSHGLVRLMNSDWSDMVYSDTSVLHYFWTAESHMNSAMVLAVFPTLIGQLDMASQTAGVKIDKGRAGQLSAALQRYLQAMRGNFYKDLGTASFSRRLYFTQTKSWGDDNMHIEPQSFLMLAPDFPRERKLQLWREVQAKLLNGEQIGPRQRDKPQVGAIQDVGSGENGGVWFALAGPMIVGVGTVDSDAAWALLRRLSMDNFAKNFPDYWVGQWTGPECFNSAPIGSIAGLPRTCSSHMFTSFPAYCAHAHAWPLYCYYRLKELPLPANQTSLHP